MKSLNTDKLNLMNNKMRWRLSRTLIVLIGIAGLVIAYTRLDHTEAKFAMASTEPAVVVSVAVAEYRAIPKRETFSGSVIGQEEIPVYADLPQGHIVEVLAEEGQWVKAGVNLAMVDTALLKIQKVQQQAVQQHANVAISQAETLLEEAKAQYVQAKSERLRGESVAEFGFLSHENLDQRTTAEYMAEARVKAAQNGLSMAQADLASANAQIAQTALHITQAAITAPVSGTIMKRNAHIGLALEKTSDPLFLILRDGAIEVELAVSATEALKLKPGRQMVIQLPGDEKTYTGRVRQAAIQVGTQKQIAKVRVKFDKSPDAIPGQTARVTVTFHSHKAIYLPETAIRFEGDSASVFTVREGKAIRVPVRVGDRSDGLLEVLEGVQPGMQIVDRFAAFLHDGEPVQVAQPAQASGLPVL